jgi:hypothetical protein
MTRLPHTLDCPNCASHRAVLTKTTINPSSVKRTYHCDCGVMFCTLETLTTPDEVRRRRVLHMAEDIASLGTCLAEALRGPWRVAAKLRGKRKVVA